MFYPEVTPSTIWNFRQNNPNLILQDAAKYLYLNKNQLELLKKILLARGVNKWFKVRRDLIAYKKQIKHLVKVEQLIHGAAKRAQASRTAAISKEKLKILNEVRGTLKKMYKTDRWQIWPDLGSHHKELDTMNTIRSSD